MPNIAPAITNIITATALACALTACGIAPDLDFLLRSPAGPAPRPGHGAPEDI